MDGLKLDKWRDNFSREVANMQVEYNSFFLSKRLADYYVLKVDETQNLSLEILKNETLPGEIADRLIEIFLNAKPEDSI